MPHPLRPVAPAPTPLLRRQTGRVPNQRRAEVRAADRLKRRASRRGPRLGRCLHHICPRPCGRQAPRRWRPRAGRRARYPPPPRWHPRPSRLWPGAPPPRPPPTPPRPPAASSTLWSSSTPSRCGWRHGAAAGGGHDRERRAHTPANGEERRHAVHSDARAGSIVAVKAAGKVGAHGRRVAAHERVGCPIGGGRVGRRSGADVASRVARWAYDAHRRRRQWRRTAGRQCRQTPAVVVELEPWRHRAARLRNPARHQSIPRRLLPRRTARHTQSV